MSATGASSTALTETLNAEEPVQVAGQSGMVGHVHLAAVDSMPQGTFDGRRSEYVGSAHARRMDSKNEFTSTELGRSYQTVLEGDVLAVSVLCADLRGFTRVAEQLSPRRTAGLLNAYLTAMVDIILARHGLIQDFVGDGILAVFGAPVLDPEHGWHAVLSAVEMQAALRHLEQRSGLDGQIPPAMGIAVHSGEVFAGTVGSPRRSKYAAVGDTVNVASRLEELNRALGTSIVISGQTIALLSDRVEVHPHGWFPIRGRCSAIELFELVALRNFA